MGWRQRGEQRHWLAVAGLPASLIYITGHLRKVIQTPVTMLDSHLQCTAFFHAIGIPQQIKGGPGYFQVLDAAHVASAADPFPGGRDIRTIHKLGKTGLEILRDSTTQRWSPVSRRTSQIQSEVIHPRK